ncbi:MAG: gamma carbonic anhydrase family protein, partial [Alphaproteobacteria bacterium]|nr:gamma carbonic anhydrase family protein [Alphaproteobacteria bacterium]
DRAFLGMGAMAMNGSSIANDAMLAAGALLTPHKAIPAGQLWAGRPARFLRNLTETENAASARNVAQYAVLAQEYHTA